MSTLPTFHGKVIFASPVFLRYNVVMTVSKEEIKKIAGLARLALTPAEEERFARTISAVLDYMKILNEVDTNKTEPTAQVTGLHDVVRPDEARSSAIRTELLKNMPQTEADLLRVPAVFDDAKIESP